MAIIPRPRGHTNTRLYQLFTVFLPTTKSQIFLVFSLLNYFFTFTFSQDLLGYSFDC